MLQNRDYRQRLLIDQRGCDGTKATIALSVCEQGKGIISGFIVLQDADSCGCKPVASEA